MRQNQNAKRSRGRGRRSGNSNQNNFNRNTTFDSNGPEGRLRGNAQQLFEKYTALAHDAASSGDRVLFEAHSQFADHYYRIHQSILANAEQRRQNDERVNAKRHAEKADNKESADEQAPSEAPEGEAVTDASQEETSETEKDAADASDVSEEQEVAEAS